MNERTPKNAPGPFYVTADACMACHAPEAEAGGLMAFDAERHTCYFARQPGTPDEEYRAIRAVCASCIAAVRYDGSDPALVQRLAEAGLGGQVDGAVPRVAVWRRTAVTFRLDAAGSPVETVAAIGYEIQARESVATSNRVHGWFNRKARPAPELLVTFERDVWMIAGIERWQNLVHDRLTAAHASDLRWYTDAAAARDGGPSSPWPI